MFVKKDYHTIVILNTACFSMTKMVKPTRLSFTLYVQYIAYLVFLQREILAIITSVKI